MLKDLFQKDKSPASRKAVKQSSLARAQFASPKELKTLSQGSGYIIGQTKERGGNILRTQLEGHALTIAPPRSGKFVNVISPNLAAHNGLGCTGPVVHIEPKGEAYSVWGRHRQSLGRDVILIDPFAVIHNLGKQSRLQHLTQAKSHCYNPLSSIPNDSTMVQHIGSLMEALIEPGTSNDNAEHFKQGAKRILSGFIAWVIATESEENQQLPFVYGLINQAQDKLIPLLDTMSQSDKGFGLPADAANLLLNVEDRERGSFLSTLTNALSFMRYPEMQSHLQRSDFDLEDLANNKLDIFVIVPGHLISELRPWLRLWVTLPITLLYHQRPKERITLMIDELAALGRIEPLERAFNLNAGYGLTIWGFTQHLKDLHIAYGKDRAEAMLGMSQLLQFFNVAPGDTTTQQYLSQVLGDISVHSNSVNQQGWFKDTQNHKTEKTRALLRAEEIVQLGSNQQIVLLKHQSTKNKPLLIYKHCN